MVDFISQAEITFQTRLPAGHHRHAVVQIDKSLMERKENPVESITREAKRQGHLVLCVESSRLARIIEEPP